jgi:hypothetical protein
MKINFFEGWYFKLVHPTEDLVYAFIPGISLFNEKHCFIQVLNGERSTFNYIRYSVDEFKSEKNNFSLEIRDNFFSLEKLILNISEPEMCIKGSLSLTNTVKWPDSIFNPGSMGFYNYLNFMQCYSQVCSISSSIIGSLNINGKYINFTNGKAYIEKNWGKSFPNSYIWVQCNNFKSRNVSLTCSIGSIPFLYKNFTGFLISLYIEKVFYKFTTMNRSKISIDKTQEEVFITTWNKHYILKIRSKANKKTFMNLMAPRNNNMLPIAIESLQAIVKIQLLDAKNNSIIFEDHGKNAGLEFSATNFSSYT